MLDKLPKFTRNLYFLGGVIFIVWMLFFDANDFYSQYQLKSKLNDLEHQRDHYLEEIEKVKKDREALLNDKLQLERFAREKYYMKKEGEEVFIIVEENE
ncbi:septum formation initiator family protein [Reichenbachiella sp. MALMAid0571]|uniref:FtsB family cell division protein n=1 Tax=Reichenbachiella sp. MALMAid0571 TaxID=3143939 RepID=UPI0032DF5FCE